MIEETEKIRLEYMESLIGQSVCVLFENEIENGIYQGYTENYIPVRLKSDKNIIGEEITCTVEAVKDDICFAN